ncbi:MAG: cystathionine gamma-synthase family protein [Nitrososphaerota archaeon]
MLTLQTKSIHGHKYRDEKNGVFIPPIYQTAIFEQPGWTRKTDRGVDLKYSREENLTVESLENVITELEEGGDSLCFSSGMAAISTIYFSTLRKYDQIVLSAESYGTTLQLGEKLREFGIDVQVSWPETENIIESINRKTKLVLIEVVTNPTLRVFNIREIAEVCRENKTILVVDNTFATPYLYKPLKDGVDIVLHSLTKYLSGHNDVLGGSITSSKEKILELWDWRRMLGTIIPPFEAFLIIRGLKTFELRMEKHCKNALIIAEHLQEHPKITEVLYPGLTSNKYHDIAKKLFNNKGFGGVVSFRIKGGEEEVVRLMKNLKIIKPAPSLGGAESILTYPVISAAMTMPKDLRDKLGIKEDLLRLSVGLEDVEDLIEDIDKALASI